jgi:hypothetical protein
MNKTIELTPKELLVLQQSIIRYLKMASIPDLAADNIVLNNILTNKLGVVTPDSLIKNARKKHSTILKGA